MTERIRVLEEQVENFTSMQGDRSATLIPPADTSGGNPQREVNEDPLNRDELIKRELSPAQYNDLGVIIECIRNMGNDPEMKEAMGMGTLRMLNSAGINIGSDKESLVIVFEDTEYGKMDYQRCGDEKIVDKLKELIAEKTGKQVNISTVLKNNREEVDVGSVNLAKVNFDINME